MIRIKELYWFIAQEKLIDFSGVVMNRLLSELEIGWVYEIVTAFVAENDQVTCDRFQVPVGTLIHEVGVDGLARLQPGDGLVLNIKKFRPLSEITNCFASSADSILDLQEVRLTVGRNDSIKLLRPISSNSANESLYWGLILTGIDENVKAVNAIHWYLEMLCNSESSGLFATCWR